MNIQQATKKDAAEISALIIESALSAREADFTLKGWDHFVAMNSPDAIHKQLSNTDNIIQCYIHEKHIVGVIIIHLFEKLDSFFVHPSYQRQGIARQLWESVKQQCYENNPLHNYWLRASTMGIPIYEKFGFVKVQEKQIKNGIAFTLMHYQTNNYN